MIPVKPRPEPVPKFDQQVRRPGNQWIARERLDPDQPLPAGRELPAYWRACLDDLHAAYEGICAYLCVFIERAVGGVSVDHFVPKSRQLKLAYEWSNYRLACLQMNARKRHFEDVLDPFSLPPDTFRLELVTGRIYVNPALSGEARQAAEDTLTRLGLDDPGCREMRARHFQDYHQHGWPADFLRRYSPFVWLEALRQGVL
jgi:uncharacterized protein (TIGR02646 family)